MQQDWILVASACFSWRQIGFLCLLISACLAALCLAERPTSFMSVLLGKSAFLESTHFKLSLVSMCFMCYILIQMYGEPAVQQCGVIFFYDCISKSLSAITLLSPFVFLHFSSAKLNKLQLFIPDISEHNRGPKIGQSFSRTLMENCFCSSYSESFQFLLPPYLPLLVFVYKGFLLYANSLILLIC